MTTVERITMIVRVTGHLAFCLAIVGLFGAQAEARLRSSSQAGGVLQAPREGLVPVHRPDLENLEPDVREQLESLGSSLAALGKDQATSDGKLGEAYGLMGQVLQAYSLTSPAEESYVNAHRLAPKDFRWVYPLGNVYQQGAALTKHSPITNSSAGFVPIIWLRRSIWATCTCNKIA